ncbi:MAG: hypothetical protein ACTSQO_14605 [Candidatus Helarchaeota archaeon]
MEGMHIGFLKTIIFFGILHDFIFGFFFIFFLPQLEYILLITIPLNYPIFAHFLGLLLFTMGVIQLISFLNLERFILLPFIINCERFAFFIIGIVDMFQFPLAIPQILIFISLNLFLSLLTIIAIRISKLSLKLH